MISVCLTEPPACVLQASSVSCSLNRWTGRRIYLRLELIASIYYTCTYTVYPHVWRCLRACVCEGMAMCTRVYLRVASHLFSACLCVKVCVLVGLCVYRCISKRNRQKERDWERQREKQRDREGEKLAYVVATILLNHLLINQINKYTTYTKTVKF